MAIPITSAPCSSTFSPQEHAHVSTPPGAVLILLSSGSLSQAVVDPPRLALVLAPAACRPLDQGPCRGDADVSCRPRHRKALVFSTPQSVGFSLRQKVFCRQVRSGNKVVRV